MEKINFSNGEKISVAKVTIDNVDYEVTPAVYDGATPLNATVFNNMQENIEDAIDTKANTSDVYTKQEVNALIPTKTHQVNVGTEVDEEYKVNLLKTKNLCDVNNMKILGGYNDSGYVSSPNYLTLQFIKVKPSTTYTLTTNLDLTKYTALRIIDFNSNQTFIRRSSGIAYTTNTYTFTTSNDAYFIALAFYTDSTASLTDITQAQVEKGSTATEYTPFVNNQINVDNEKYGDTINVGAVEDSRSRVNILHSENLIKPTLATSTQNGVTCTNNGDGTYTLNGTATDTCQFNILTNLNLTGSYKMTGCPSTGSQDTYYMFARNSAWSKFIGDTGEGIIGVFDSTVTVMCIAVTNGTTCDNVVFKPMITKDTSKTYADFEPYVVPSIKVDNEEIYRKPKVLWENSSITSDFSNQTITLNDSLENYDYYEVIFLMSKYEQLALSSGLIPSSMSTSITTIRLAGGTGIIARYRDISRNSATTLMITKASKISGSSTTITEEVDRVIPYRIIGH